MSIKKISIVLNFFILTSHLVTAQNQLHCPVHNMKILESHYSIPIVGVMGDKKEVYSLISGTVTNISKDSGRMVITDLNSTFAIIMFTFDKIHVQTGDTVNVGDYLGDMIKIANKTYVLKLICSGNKYMPMDDFRSLLCTCRKNIKR
jgi:hypothetical protein